MDRTSMFDAITYFTEMTEKNVLAKKEGFQPVVISGPDNLEGIFEEFRDYDRFVAVTPFRGTSLQIQRSKDFELIFSIL